MSTARKVVLAIGAHPDDVEFTCAGTLALLKDKGFEVHIATVTDGDMGSTVMGREEIGRVRQEEARNSAQLLGGSYHYLGGHDFEVLRSMRPLRVAVVELLRKVNPTLILAPPPVDYMFDHEETSWLVRYATFVAPAPNFETAHGPTPGIVHLYYVDAFEGKDYMGKPVPAELYVDISGVMETKERMLACHASQREWLQHQHGIDRYIDGVKGWMAARGKEAGFEFAEAFSQHQGHPYPQDDVLGSLLPSRRAGAD